MTPALNARNMNAIVESINTLGYAVGGPNVANTVSEMTDTSKVYVYTGSETGYTSGNWYYYNGSAWVSGGVYQATAVETDTTLTVPGEPADAKATGDIIFALKNELETSSASLPHAWQQGVWGANAGGYNPDIDNAICTYDLLSTDIIRVYCSNTYRIRVHAWIETATASNYKGMWNGQTFIKSNEQSVYHVSVDLNGLYRDYPDYRFKLVLFKSDLTSSVQIEDAVNVSFVHYTTELIEKNISNLERSLTSNNLYWLDWDNVIYYINQGFFGPSSTRIGLQNMQTAKTDITVSVKDGYKVSCVVFSQPVAELQYEDHRSGWVKSYILKAGEHFLLNLAHSDDSAITPAESDNLQIMDSADLYQYRITGKKIDLSVQGFNVVKQPYDLPLPRAIHEGLTSRQDFDIYDGVLFQLYSDNYVALLNLDTGSVIASYPLNSGHSNSCQFSEEFYDSSDRFPLLYCFGYDDNYCYVNRVTDSGAELIQTYYLQTDGYRFSGGVDSKNNRLITIHFTKNSSTDISNNHNIVTVWDLNKVTDDGNGHLIPSIVKQTDIPFLPVVQGCTWFKDALYVTSGYYDPYRVTVKLTAFDTGGNVVTEITDFPSEIKQGEAEGITFYKSQNKFECYFATYYMYKLVF